MLFLSFSHFDTILLLLTLQLLLIFLSYLCSILPHTQLSLFFSFFILRPCISPYSLSFLSFPFLLPLCLQPYTDYYSHTRSLSLYIFRYQLRCVICDGSSTYSVKLFFFIYIYSTFHYLHILFITLSVQNSTCLSTHSLYIYVFVFFSYSSSLLSLNYAFYSLIRHSSLFNNPDTLGHFFTLHYFSSTYFLSS